MMSFVVSFDTVIVYRYLSVSDDHYSCIEASTSRENNYTGEGQNFGKEKPRNAHLKGRFSTLDLLIRVDLEKT